MKKALAIITLFSYLLVTCGVVISHHYCMNRLASTQLFVSDEKYCDGCGMHADESDGCCRDEVQVFRFSEDQQKASETSFRISLPPAALSFPSDYLHQPLLNPVAVRYIPPAPEPLLSGQDTYLRTGALLI
jgi:hypothetical protein